MAHGDVGAGAPNIFDKDANLERTIHIRRYAFGMEAPTMSNVLAASSRLSASLSASGALGASCARIALPI